MRSRSQRSNLMSDEKNDSAPAEPKAAPAPTAEAPPPAPEPAPAPAAAPAAPPPSQSDKVLAYLSQVPAWLWAASASSFVFFTGFLVFISQQAPDQYAMTTVPPWEHNLNPSELIAYHRALKSGAFNGNEIEAKRYLYRQGSSSQLFARQSYSNTRAPETLSRNLPQKPLTIEQITSFASSSQPVNKGSFQQAQEYVANERKRYNSINELRYSTNANGIYIQTASLRSPQDANALQAELQRRGYAPFIQEAFVKGSKWYRVRFGPYQSMAEAEQAARNLRANRYTAQVIRTP